MNEEEKKEEQKLIDLGDGRFIDQTHFLTLLDQNKQKYANRWTLKGRQNEVLDSINNFRQQIVDGNITGRKANTNWLTKPGFENTKWDEFARGFANELIAQAPSDSILFAKPKEEPKEEPKKYDTSLQRAFNNQYGRMDSWRAKGYDELTGVWDAKPLIQQMQELARQHKTQNVGKGLDFTGSRYADEADFIKVMDEISQANTIDDMVRLMGRTGWEENVDDLGATYFGRTPKTQPAQPAQPTKTQEQIDAEEDDAAWRDFFEKTYVVPFESHKLPNDFRSGTQYRLHTGYENDPAGYGEKVGSVWVALNNLQQDNPENQRLQNLDILGLYTDYYNTEGFKENFTEDKDGFYYHDHFVVPYENGDGDYGYYVSFNPTSNTIRFNYIKNNLEILENLRNAFIKTRVDERNLKRRHYKEKGGIIKMLRGGGTKPDSTLYYHLLNTTTPISLEAVMAGSVSSDPKTPDDPLEKAKQNTKQREEANKKALEGLQKEAETNREEWNYIKLMTEIERKKLDDEKKKKRLSAINHLNMNAALDDLSSVLIGLGPWVWTDAVSTGAGLAAALQRGAANSLDKATPWYSDLGKFVVDVGASAMSFAPGLFDAVGRAGKAQKAAGTILNLLGTGMAVGNIAYLSTAEREKLLDVLYKVNNGHFDQLTTEDVQILSSFIGSVSAVGRKAEQTVKHHRAVNKGKVTANTIDQFATNPKEATSYNKKFYNWSTGKKPQTTQPTQTPTKPDNGEINPWRHPLDALEARKAQKAAEQAFYNRVDFYGGNHKKMVDDWIKYGGTAKQLQDAADRLQASGLVKNEMEALEYLSEQLKIKTVPNHVIAELDQLLTPSNKKGGKLNQLKALRKGGILKCQQGNPILDASEKQRFEDYKKWYETKYGTEKANSLNPDTYMISNDFNDYVKSTNVDNSNITRSSWRDTGNQKYFDGKSYNDQATKDFHRYLNIMDPTKRQQGFDALKAAGDNTELWNQTFQQHFGNINQNIVGYNPEVDNFNGVSTKFRRDSIDSYKPNPPKPVTTDDVNPKVDLELPETIPEAVTTAREQELEEVGSRLKQGAGNTQPQYLKLNENANAVGRYINQLRGAQRQHDLQEQALLDGKRRLVKEVIPTREVRNDFGFTPYDQAMTDITNRLNDPNLTPQERSQLYNQYSQLEVQKGAYQSQRTDMSAQQKFEDVSKQASIDHKYAQDQSDIDTALAYSLKMNDVSLVNGTTALNEGFATQIHLNNQNQVKGYNEAVMKNAMAGRKADLDAAIAYANSHYSNDPIKWQEHVNPYQKAYEQGYTDESNRYWGIKPKVDSGYNYDLRKSGGKLNKKEIESLKFLSKQIETQTKSRDRGLDRLSKVTYKAILKSLGL